MDSTDRKLLDAMQAGIPLVERPYRVLGEGLGLSEQEVLCRIAALKNEGLIRNVSGIFDTRSLGYRSCLVGFGVGEERIDQAAALVSAHPGVSHNYLRACAFSRPNFSLAYCPFNLWFTLAVPSESRLGLEATASYLAREARADAVRLFPNRKVFKIGVRLKMDGDAASEPKEEKSSFSGHGASALTNRLEPFQHQVIQLLQEDLPLLREPFRGASEQYGFKVEEMLKCARELSDRGIMRRYAAVLNHRRAGYTGNIMAVWLVPEEKIDAAGLRAAEFRAVSHCYQRPAYPEWPFTLYTMIHERSREGCEQIVEAISGATGIDDYAKLWTAREFKKVRLRYFTKEFSSWEENALEHGG